MVKNRTISIVAIGGFFMWLDNASEIDILFYGPYAKLISNIAKSKNYNPLTIGVFGLWGAGKSTLLELIKKELDPQNSNVACISLNAWMFEGYEDAKVALIESLLNQLYLDETKFQAVKSRISDLLKRVDYFKLGTDILSKGAPIVASIATGNPLPLLLGIQDSFSAKGIAEKLTKSGESITHIKENYIKEPNDTTVENLRVFKEEFESTLSESDIDNVIVLIDDLDRCNPDRIIDTLEAIKLFLSVKKTTFIIAADETVIQYAIKRKYPSIDESTVEISSEYIEKIIQLPIYIPELSSKDLENYLLLLITQLHLNEGCFTRLVDCLYERDMIVRESRIDLSEINEIISELNLTFKSTTDDKLFQENSEVIANIKSIVSSTLKGNPRQAKRFLNTFMTKKKLAEMYFTDGVDSKILAKMLTLQKINPELFRELNEWNKEFDIENKKLREVAEYIDKNPESIPKALAQWASPRLISWMDVEPKDLYKYKLDKYFYLSREELKDNTSVEVLSERVKQVLETIMSSTKVTAQDNIRCIEKLKPEELEEVLKVFLPRIKPGELEWHIIRYLFEYAPGYRAKILEEVKLMPKLNLGARSIPYLIKMREISKPEVDEMLGRMLKNGKIKKALYERLVH